MKNCLLAILLFLGISNLYAQRDYSDMLTASVDVSNVKSEMEARARNYATSIMYKYGGESNLSYKFFDVETGRINKTVRGFMEDGATLGALGLYVEWQDSGQDKCIVLAEILYDMYSRSNNFSYRVTNFNEAVKRYNKNNGSLLVGLAALVGSAYYLSNSSSFSGSSAYNKPASGSSSQATQTTVRSGSRSKSGVEIVSWTSGLTLGNNNITFRLRNKNGYDVVVVVELLNQKNVWKKDFKECFLKAGQLAEFTTLGDSWQKSKDIGIYQVQ